MFDMMPNRTSKIRSDEGTGYVIIRDARVGKCARCAVNCNAFGANIKLRWTRMARLPLLMSAALADLLTAIRPLQARPASAFFVRGKNWNDTPANMVVRRQVRWTRRPNVQATREKKSGPALCATVRVVRRRSLAAAILETIRTVRMASVVKRPNLAADPVESLLCFR
jgi:hypothetical protein